MHTQHPVGFGGGEGPERVPWTLSREVARGLSCELGEQYWEGVLQSAP